MTPNLFDGANKNGVQSAEDSTSSTTIIKEKSGNHSRAPHDDADHVAAGCNSVVIAGKDVVVVDLPPLASADVPPPPPPTQDTANDISSNNNSNNNDHNHSDGNNLHSFLGKLLQQHDLPSSAVRIVNDNAAVSQETRMWASVSFCLDNNNNKGICRWSSMPDIPKSNMRRTSSSPIICKQQRGGSRSKFSVLGQQHTSTRGGGGGSSSSMGISHSTGGSSSACRFTNITSGRRDGGNGRSNATWDTVPVLPAQSSSSGMLRSSSSAAAALASSAVSAANRNHHHHHHHINTSSSSSTKRNPSTSSSSSSSFLLSVMRKQQRFASSNDIILAGSGRGISANSSSFPPASSSSSSSLTASCYSAQPPRLPNRCYSPDGKKGLSMPIRTFHDTTTDFGDRRSGIVLPAMPLMIPPSTAITDDAYTSRRRTDDCNIIASAVSSPSLRHLAMVPSLCYYDNVSMANVDNDHLSKKSTTAATKNGINEVSSNNNINSIRNPDSARGIHGSSRHDHQQQQQYKMASSKESERRLRNALGSMAPNRRTSSTKKETRNTNTMNINKGEYRHRHDEDDKAGHKTIIIETATNNTSSSVPDASVDDISTSRKNTKSSLHPHSHHHPPHLHPNQQRSKLKDPSYNAAAAAVAAADQHHHHHRPQHRSLPPSLREFDIISTGSHNNIAVSSSTART